MRAPNLLKTEAADLGDDLDRRDIWLFGPLIAVVVALPLAIVTVLSVSLWFVAHRADLNLAAQPAPTNFASRFVVPPVPGTFLR